MRNDGCETVFLPADVEWQQMKPITRQLVERYGGTIRVDSKLGQGATFTVILPLAED